MSLKMVSTEREVVIFLTDLKKILLNPNFKASRDLDLIPKKKTESPTDPYTTSNTMLILEFDRHDVINHLLSLGVYDYLETFIDDKYTSLPPFFAFGRIIKDREVYIKVKIRDIKNFKVFCVSFHFARYPLPAQKPYA